MGIKDLSHYRDEEGACSRAVSRNFCRLEADKELFTNTNKPTNNDHIIEEDLR